MRWMGLSDDAALGGRRLDGSIQKAARASHKDSVGCIGGENHRLQTHRTKGRVASQNEEPHATVQHGTSPPPTAVMLRWALQPSLPDYFVVFTAASEENGRNVGGS